MARTILHSTMALILLVSVTGFTVNKHYCGDELTAISFLADAGGCLDDVCTNCEDVVMDCRIEGDMFFADKQYLPENKQPETGFAGLQSTEDLTIPERVFPLRSNDKLTENITGHKIHLFQSFRC